MHMYLMSLGSYDSPKHTQFLKNVFSFIYLLFFKYTYRDIAVSFLRNLKLILLNTTENNFRYANPKAKSYLSINLPINSLKWIITS